MTGWLFLLTVRAQVTEGLGSVSERRMIVVPEEDMDLAYHGMKLYAEAHTPAWKIESYEAVPVDVLDLEHTPA